MRALLLLPSWEPCCRRAVALCGSGRRFVPARPAPDGATGLSGAGALDLHSARAAIDDHPAQELPGTLNWALEGRARLNANRRFTEPKLSRDAIAEYRAESNRTRIFFTEFCAAGGSTATEMLYLYYKTWAKDHGYPPLNVASFGKEVAKRRARHSSSVHSGHIGNSCEPIIRATLS